MAAEAITESPPRRLLKSDPVRTVRLVTLVLLLVLYEATARSGLLYAGVVPPLLDIGKALIELLLSPSFYPHFGVTVLEASSGLVIGGVFGVVIGLLLAYSRFFGDALYPWFLWMAPTPKIILVPILFLFFGLGVGSKIGMAAISAFFPLFVTAFAGGRQIRPVLIRVMQSFDATAWQIIRLVYLPSLLIPILGALRLGLGLAIIGSLLAEIKAAKMGLGMLLIESYDFFRIPEMYAILVVIFALAMLANFAMDRFTARISRSTSSN